MPRGRISKFGIKPGDRRVAFALSRADYERLETEAKMASEVEAAALQANQANAVDRLRWSRG